MSPKRRLDLALDRLQRKLPRRVAAAIDWLRRPSGKWLRIPAGLLLTVGGILSFLPVLGIWMLPLGLVLLAYDAPALQPPVGRMLLSSEVCWRKLRQRWRTRLGRN